METQTDQSLPESTSEELEAVLSQLTTDQIRFIVARQSVSTDKEAAGQIGVSPATVKQWKYRDNAPIDEATRLMAEDGLIVARHVRRRNLAKAMLVKAAGLDSEDERVRQDVATEFVEWELGKATQPQTVGNPDGTPLKAYISLSPDDWDKTGG